MSGILKKTFYFAAESSGAPPVDLYETPDELVLEMDIPGVSPENVRIRLHDEMLVIEGIRKSAREERPLKFLCMERDTRSFRRKIRLPAPVGQGSGSASYANGVLTLRFRKSDSTVIKIKVVEEQE